VYKHGTVNVVVKTSEYLLLWLVQRIELIS